MPQLAEPPTQTQIDIDLVRQIAAEEGYQLSEEEARMLAHLDALTIRQRIREWKSSIGLFTSKWR